MEPFYWVTLVIACILLILGLVAFSMLLKSADSTIKYPTTHRPCPDDWRLDGSNCYSEWHVPDAKNQTLNFGNGCDTVGTVVQTSLRRIDVSNRDLSYAFIAFNASSTTCDKKAWTDMYKINWDGVSNYNSC